MKIYNHMVVDNLSLTFTALSDPTRRAIMERLTQGPASVNELAEPFRMSQQAISKHIAYLERAQLVKKEKDGRQNICSLNPTPLRQLDDWAEQYRHFWEEAFDRLGEFLMQKKPASRKRYAKTKK